MNIETSIRQAKASDAEQLADLAKRSMPGYPFLSIYDPATLKHEIESCPNRIVAESNSGKIVGTAVLGDGHMAEIKRVLVDTQYRGNHLGEQLTSTLKQMAKDRGVIPYADVRGDQIGMQRAAHRYNLKLTPTSLEPGKHVVYYHQYPPGRARETMVSFTGLELAHDLDTLIKGIKKWPKEISHALVSNMIDSLHPRRKVSLITNLILPSAKSVKARVIHKVRNSGLPYTQLTPDITKFYEQDTSCLVIAPDASAFIEGKSVEGITNLLDNVKGFGLQLVTCYVAIANSDMVLGLAKAGMKPTMVRPWQEAATDQPQWQVGLRHTGNYFDHSHHPIKLDPDVKSEIEQIIKNIDKI